MTTGAVDLTATPAELLGAARAVLETHPGAGAGLWPRTVALLTRQALELAVAEVWAERGLDMTAVSAHAQLLCLGEYVGQFRLASDVRYAWWALTRACHHHPYELAATASELDAWITIVGHLVDRMAPEGASDD